MAAKVRRGEPGMIKYARYRSAWGTGYVLTRENKVLLLTLPGGGLDAFRRLARQRLDLDPAAIDEVEELTAAREVEEFLAGRRRRFDFAVDPPGTDFQKLVWRCLMDIPYGAVATYGEIAARLGRPGAARAVGAACAANPVALAVPCHRAVGAGGDLTGFAGGLPLKQALLAMERERLYE